MKKAVATTTALGILALPVSASAFTQSEVNGLIKKLDTIDRVLYNNQENSTELGNLNLSYGPSEVGSSYIGIGFQTGLDLGNIKNMFNTEKIK